MSAKSDVFGHKCTHTHTYTERERETDEQTENENEKNKKIVTEYTTVCVAQPLHRGYLDLPILLHARCERQAGTA